MNLTVPSTSISTLVINVYLYLGLPAVEHLHIAGELNRDRPGLYMYIYQSILPKGRSFTAHSGTKAAVLLKGRSSTANSGTEAAVLLGMDRCGSFTLLSAAYSLYHLNRSYKTQGHQRGGEESEFG